MQKPIRRILSDCSGSALIEYSLLLGGIAIALLSAISALGNELTATYQAIISGVASIGAGFGS
jgi:Flp pilus assembly pilin Flp